MNTISQDNLNQTVTNSQSGLFNKSIDPQHISLLAATGGAHPHHQFNQSIGGVNGYKTHQ